MRIDTDSPVVKQVRREILIKEATEGSGFKNHRVMVTFEVIDKSEFKALASEGDDAVIERVLKGWGDPKKDNKGGFDDMNGEPLPFTPEVLAKLLEKQWIGSGLVRAYTDVAYGGKLGN